MKFPSKSSEQSFLQQGYSPIIGVDEVGMACLAGPVVVCALAVEPAFYERRHPALVGIRDSKMLSASRREYFSDILVSEPGLSWQIGRCEPAVIDEINIYQASRVVMRQAIKDLGLQNNDCMVLVDGNKLIKDIDLPQQAIVKGDQKIWAIAAASIIAKVHRDRLMTEYAREYPGYGFEIHKGYPTKRHYAALATLGPCPIHRHSFRGVDVIPVRA